MRLDKHNYSDNERFELAFEEEWREYFSTFPEIALLPPKERERFKPFVRKIVDHLNGRHLTI